MPKIIADLENRILEEAQKQIRENGMDGLKIRSIASAMGIAPGTIYNYYPSKDSLLSRMLVNDWSIIFDNMTEQSMESRTVHDCLVSISSNYSRFTEKYASLLTAYNFEKQPSYAFQERHSYLVDTLSQLLAKALANIGVTADSKICWMFAQIIIDLNNENKDYMSYLDYFEKLLDTT